MAEDFYMDEEMMTEVVSEFRRIGQDTQQIHDELVAVLRAFDGCWGNDEYGSNFAQQYVPGAESGLEVLNKLANVISGSADNLDHARKQFMRVDGGNAERIDRTV